MSAPTVKEIRDRAWHYISPNVAADCGLSFDELKRFAFGGNTPNDEALSALARRMGFKVAS
jgi:hypothetical protein